MRPMPRSPTSDEEVRRRGHGRLSRSESPGRGYGRQGLCTPLSPSSVLYSVLPTCCEYATCLGLRVFVVLDRMSMGSRRSAPSCGSVSRCRSVTVTAEVRIRRRVEVRVLSSETGPGGGAGSAGRRGATTVGGDPPRRAAPAARAGRRVTERGCWRYARSVTRRSVPVSNSIHHTVSENVQ